MHSQFTALTALWFVLFVVIAIHFWRRRTVLSGVALTHTVIFTSAHALQGFVYTIPWYTPEWDPEVIFLGYSQAVIAFAALTFGYMIFIPVVNALVSTKRSARQLSVVIESPPLGSSFLQQHLPVIYLMIGIIAQFILTPLAADTPTVSAFTTALSKLYPIGLALALFRSLAETRVNYVSIGLIGLGGIALLSNTIIANGFIGFVLPPIAFLAVYTLLRLRRARVILPIAVATLYVGLSLLTTYYTQRTEIRGIVWSSADFETRFATVQDSLINNFSLFDINNENHLWAIDERMSLNRLIGLSVERLDRGNIVYAQGQTIIDAISTVIPRILWTDKPIPIGGNYLVRFYTGLYFNDRTAVALGQVLEFYVNFGTFGVVVGFIALSALLYVVDQGIARAIRRNNLMNVAVWMSPVFSLWLVEDNYVATVGAGVSTLLTVVFVNFALRSLFSERLMGPFFHGASKFSRSTTEIPVVRQQPDSPQSIL